jgi:group I intron endonuclease
MQLIELTQENKNSSGIYCITNTIDNRIYIGSCKNFKSRIKEHLNCLKRNNHNNIYLQNFVNKYGIESLKFHIIEFSEIINLVNIEQYYLDTLNTKFNICKKAYQPPVKYSLTEEQIKQIADLYNNGKTGCQIAELLFNDRNYRVKINSLIRGDSYKEYSHLFNYRKYTQIGRRFSEETKNKISKANIGTTALSEKDINFIKENYLTTSGRKIAKLINKNHRTVAYYIKTKLKNGL